MSVAQNKSISESPCNKESRVKFGRTYRLVTTLVGWTPLSLGMKLRNFIYRIVFEKMGAAIQIEQNVHFTRTYLIQLGNGVYIRSGANVEACGENSRLSIRDKAIIERGADIRAHEGGEIEIGASTHIGPYTCLSGRSIKIGKNCLIASHAGIYANNHVFTDPSREINKQGRSYQGIVIEDDCWLGSGVRVLDGVTIGKGSVIGAGAVVTKDIAPYSVAVGVPAKVISQRSGDDPLLSHSPDSSKC